MLFIICYVLVLKILYKLYMDDYKGSFRQVIDILIVIALISAVIAFCWLGYNQYYP
jgi:hypothetical protein